MVKRRRLQFCDQFAVRTPSLSANLSKTVIPIQNLAVDRQLQPATKDSFNELT